MKLKISFLMAAHNEEKIIRKSLNNLLKIPYKNYEVIIGLDGCTDRTEDIVKNYCKKSKKFKYFNLNIRKGKPAVINQIIKKAKGDIIIINDADWIFRVKSEEDMNNFISVFNDERIGGIAESFPVELDKEKIKKGNLGYKMVAYSSFFWLKYQKENLAYKEKDILYAKESTMFLTNIFRKKLFRPNFSLGDDFERTGDIMSQGYKIVILEDEEMPRMVAAYNKIAIRDLFKQKIRTAIARKQINDERKASVNIRNYYFPSILFMLKESWNSGLKVGFYVTFWILLTTLASILSNLSRIKDTREGWSLRASR